MFGFIHLVDVFYTPFVIVALSVLYRSMNAWAESNQAQVKSKANAGAKSSPTAVRQPAAKAEVTPPRKVVTPPAVKPIAKPAAQPKARTPRPTLEDVMRQEAERRLGEAS
ncbi:hypothetical protein C1752_10443 [Acaryochloris thomasi RCC1774]|uniref:Uncharacterized protein n=1 Tax=Acaryochloris thomasi RCC1774 TaxID=1764569 RepID=A0A2W1J848_9CYAN|nr:hypothetical protein [Acaryochloris thomasi]PZD70593.1 hypothetical protein C1752_10443 [Acaryochloris thomasi RCC1774]